MNFDPTDEQRRWRDLARDFAQGEIRPHAAQLDREQKFPYDIVAKMTDLGFMGMTVPQEYGGSGGDFVAYNLALEEISRADTSVGITMEAHISLGCSPLVSFGTREQRQHFLGEVIQGGRNLWAFGLTEENAGTDAGGTQTTAELEDVDHQLRHGHHRRGDDHRPHRHARERQAGANRDHRPAGDARLHEGSRLREDGLARLRPAPALLRGLPGAGREPVRRARQG